VIIGVIVLIVGAALFIGGLIGVLSSITLSTTFTQPQPGEYVSAEILLNSSSGLVVTSPATVGGIVPAADLSLVNPSNINTYVIPYNSTAGGSYVYRSISGDYYYVAFSSTQPNSKIVATPLNSSLVRYGVVVLVGIVCAIAGIVIAVIGAFQNRRPRVQGQVESSGQTLSH